MWPFKLTDRRIYRRMGYELYQKEYYLRYLSEIQNWSQHILNTKHFIINTAKKCSNHKSAVVLGSGWCIDVPVMELSRMFEKVYFVDLLHPPKVIAKFKEFENVQFVTEDITKIVGETYNCVNRYKNFSVDMLSSSTNYSTADYTDLLINFDFVVSVNTLAFLDDLILDYLMQMELIDDLSAKNLSRFIQTYHLGLLPKGKSCVITPVKIKTYNAEGLEMYDRPMLFFDTEDIAGSKEWIWNYSSGHLTTGRRDYTVKAWEV